MSALKVEMGSKTGAVKRPKRQKITLETKRKIIEEYEKGTIVACLARAYNKPTSTICSILKSRDVIKELDPSTGISRINKSRLSALDDVEKLLLSWMNERQSKGDLLTQSMICQKAKEIFKDRVRATPGSTKADEDLFKASNGWFDKFKIRTNIHVHVRHSDPAPVNTSIADSFVAEFNQQLLSSGYFPQQVFNCEEVVLFWKKMPKSVYVCSKPLRERLSLLLCANASGDLKIKPLLVNHYETPRVFKERDVDKSKLNVMWRWNLKAGMTREFLIEWINHVFGPAVREYLIRMELPLCALLVLGAVGGNATEDLQFYIFKEFDFIKIHYLPAKFAPLIQPMSLQIMPHFKKLYTKFLFECCYEVIRDTDLTVAGFCRDSMHAIVCLELIDKAWSGMPQQLLSVAWKKLWPQINVGCAPDSLSSESESVISDILGIARCMGLELDENEISELVGEHKSHNADEAEEAEGPEEPEDREEPEEYKYDKSDDVGVREGSEMSEKHEAVGMAEQPDAINEPQVVVSELPAPSYNTNALKRALRAWNTVATFVQQNHPNPREALDAINLFSGTALAPFASTTKNENN